MFFDLFCLDYEFGKNLIIGRKKAISKQINRSLSKKPKRLKLSISISCYFHFLETEIEII